MKLQVVTEEWLERNVQFKEGQDLKLMPSLPEEIRKSLAAAKSSLKWGVVAEDDHKNICHSLLAASGEITVEELKEKFQGQLTAIPLSLQASILSDALRKLVFLKGLKRKIEAGKAVQDEVAVYNRDKERAWDAAESLLAAIDMINESWGRK